MDNPGTGYSSHRAAVDIAAILNDSEDDGWTYKAVRPEGSSYSYIESYDSDGKFLGRL